MPRERSAAKATASRRDLAVARVLDPARERAELRVQAFLDAAVRLINSPSGEEFTVQEVIESSGQSLRSFYQHFDGKYELLLALFEDAIRTAAATLRDSISEETDPLDRLRRFVVDYYRSCQPGELVQQAKKCEKAAVSAFAGFSQQLLTEHPQDAANAFYPLVELLEHLLTEAAAAGSIATVGDQASLAGVILQSLYFSRFAATISAGTVQKRTGESAELFWSLLLNGLAPAAT